MLEAIFTPATMPFSIALGVMIGLVLLEIVSSLLGFALSHTVDNALDLDVDVDIDHDISVDAPDANLNADAGHVPVAAQVLDWLHVGSVPIMVLFMIFLFGFGLTGLAVQAATKSALSAWIACIPAIAMGVVLMKALGGLARKFVFREDSTAVSNDSLVGLAGTITLGVTRKGHPTQAKLKDRHDQTHYVLVEALREGDEFDSGDNVLLVQRDGHKYYVIENSVETLLNLGPEDLSAELRTKA